MDVGAFIQHSCHMATKYLSACCLGAVPGLGFECSDMKCFLSVFMCKNGGARYFVLMEIFLIKKVCFISTEIAQ